MGRVYDTSTERDWNWTLHETAGGGWSYELIHAALLSDIRAEMKLNNSRLLTLISRLDGLGTDGIHELIRFEARRARAADAKRRKRLASARRKARAAKRSEAK